MKKNRFFAILGISLAMFGTAACVDGPDNEVPPIGENFYTGCPVKFFFVDENGEDLVHLEDVNTYPLGYPVTVTEDVRGQAIPAQIVRAGNVSVYVYNFGQNFAWQDPESERTAFQTYLWGRVPEPTFLTYVYAGNGWDADSLRVGYKYLNGSETASGRWAVEVISMEYNGVEVFKANPEKTVYVVKPSEGETVVKVGRLN